jgi:hypothetical protein
MFFLHNYWKFKMNVLLLSAVNLEYFLIELLIEEATEYLV